MTKIKLPNTRYYGSKRRVVEKIWDVLCNEKIQFDSFLDVFGGTGIVSYYMLNKGKRVIYNDILKFNCINAKALLESPKNTLKEDEALALCKRRDDVFYRNVIEKNFEDIYYTDVENRLIDTIVQNISFLSHDKQMCAFYLLFQSCMVKRPFNIFHRKNLYLRLNHKTSSFGNYVTWEREFSELFKKFLKELNEFQFAEIPNITITNTSALECQETADLVYIDTPYFSSSSNISYHARYHFLEGLVNYSKIENNIDQTKQNKEIKINATDEFGRKSTFICDLRKLINKFEDKIIVMSYTSCGYPTIDELK
ncbi:MAG: DNA adenine methylase, partial [Prevotellaceae bacterium]|nr:DNA adenine methylase [Prevotellaceae bacterium]